MAFWFHSWSFLQKMLLLTMHFSYSKWNHKSSTLKNETTRPHASYANCRSINPWCQSGVAYGWCWLALAKIKLKIKNKRKKKDTEKWMPERGRERERDVQYEPCTACCMWLDPAHVNVATTWPPPHRWSPWSFLSVPASAFARYISSVFAHKHAQICQILSLGEVN